MGPPSLPKALLRLAALVVLALSVLLVASRFTSEMHWGVEDFLAAAGLLFGAGVAYLLLSRHARRPLHRTLVAIAVVAVVAVVWAELAVGLFR